MAEGGVKAQVRHESGGVSRGGRQDAVDLLDGGGGVGLRAAHIGPGGISLGCSCC
jgi:hypothetical protein